MTISNPMPWPGGPKRISDTEQSWQFQDRKRENRKKKEMRWGGAIAALSRSTLFLSHNMVRIGTTALALSGGLLGGLSGGQRAFAQAAPPLPSAINYPPGLCYQGQRNISNSWVNDGTGQLVPLSTLCDVAIQHQETLIMPPVETAFWQAFIIAASPEALEFAHEAEVKDVVAYGQTICPSLHELGTMDELRVFQAQGGLPASFDAAVNVAAIHTYCPEKTRSIGR